MASVQQMLLGLGGIPAGLVKSVQQVSVVIAAAGTTATNSCTAVVTANTAVFFSGVRGANAALNYATDSASIVLTNSTTVTATRNSADATNSLIVVCTLVEFNSASIQSIQTGSIALTAAVTATNTITPFTAANTVVLFNGSTTTDTSASLAINAVGLDLLSGTYVRATRITGTNNVTAYYTVLEFAAGILNSSTQQSIITMTSSATGTASLSGVTLAQTMLVWGGFKSSVTGSADYAPWLKLTNTTTVTATRSTGTGTITAYFSAIEFKSSDIQSMNRGSLTIATSSALQAVTIGAVNTAKTIANWLGQSHSAGAFQYLENSFASLSEFDATTIKASRIQADASTSHTVGYEAVEFK